MTDTPKKGGDKHPADVFVDKMLVALHLSDAPFPVREMADKVFRPYIKLITELKENKNSATDTADAVEAVCAMMINNYVSLLTDQPEAFQDASQEILNNTALRINEDILRRFYPTEKDNVVQLPKRH